MSAQPTGLARWLSIMAAALTVLILADQLLGGRVRLALEAELDRRSRRRARTGRESFTPGAELVIARAEEITEEAAEDE